jgi:hypothetical protein
MSPLSKIFHASLLISSIYAAPLIPRAAANNKILIGDLISSPTAVDRVKALLTDDPQNFVFNFIANTNKTGAGNRYPILNKKGG